MLRDLLERGLHQPLFRLRRVFRGAWWVLPGPIIARPRPVPQTCQRPPTVAEEQPNQVALRCKNYLYTVPAHKCSGQEFHKGGTT